MVIDGLGCADREKSPEGRRVAQVEGWILGVRAVLDRDGILTF
jgi:hypothetical protein